MKKGFFYIIIFAGILPFAGCKEDVPTIFAEPDGIYFSASSDSLYYTFAKYPNRTVDTLKIPVTVLGKAAEVDRVFRVDKIPDSGFNGVEGVHYKLLSPYTLPAGKITMQIPVVIYKTGDMDSLLIQFKLRLTENENFVSGISSKAFLKVKVAYLQKPPTWGEFGGSQWAGFNGNFGTWSKTKYKVILDALYDPVNDTTVSEFPYQRTGAPAISIQYMQMVRNYLRTKYPGNFTSPRGNGATLRDPDNKDSVIQVGPANY